MLLCVVLLVASETIVPSQLKLLKLNVIFCRGKTKLRAAEVETH